MSVEIQSYNFVSSTLLAFIVPCVPVMCSVRLCATEHLDADILGAVYILYFFICYYLLTCNFLIVSGVYNCKCNLSVLWNVELRIEQVPDVPFFPLVY